MSGEMTAQLRVLALVTDAFGGTGGIAQYNRNFLSSLASCDGVGEVISLPREGEARQDDLAPGLKQLSPASGRVAYSLAALRAAQFYRPVNVVFCGHLFMAPLAAAVARLFGARLWI